MVDYEKGVPSWDIAMILTRHNSTPGQECNRVLELRRSAQHNLSMRRGSAPSTWRPISSRQRLENAQGLACSCGAGDSKAEQTTRLREERETKREDRPSVPAGDGAPTN